MGRSFERCYYTKGGGLCQEVSEKFFRVLLFCPSSAILKKTARDLQNGKSETGNRDTEWVRGDENMTAAERYAAEYLETMIANGQIPTVEQMMGAGMSEADATNWYNQLVAAAQPAATGGGGSSPNKEQTKYIDEKGFIYTKDANGNAKYIGHESNMPEDTQVVPEKGEKGAEAYATDAQNRDQALTDKIRKATGGN
jgi:hypothetical protein